MAPLYKQGQGLRGLQPPRGSQAASLGSGHYLCIFSLLPLFQERGKSRTSSVFRFHTSLCSSHGQYHRLSSYLDENDIMCLRVYHGPY